MGDASRTSRGTASMRRTVLLACTTVNQLWRRFSIEATGQISLLLRSKYSLVYTLAIQSYVRYALGCRCLLAKIRLAKTRQAKAHRTNHSNEAHGQ